MPTPTITKAADPGLVNSTTGIGGDEYYPMDQTETSTDDAATTDDADEATDMKPGAKALTEIHEHLIDVAEQLERLQEGQEHPDVQRHLDKLAARLDREAGEVIDCFKKLYPGIPAPGPGNDDVDGDGDVDVDDMDKAEGMSEESGSDGGDAVGPDDAIRKSMDSAKGRARFQKRLDLSRSWRDLCRTKRLGKSHTGIIQKAAEHLETAGEHEGDWGGIHRAASCYHAKALRGMCKNVSAALAGTEDEQEKAGVMAKSLQQLSSKEREELESLRERVPALETSVKKLVREIRLARDGR